MPKMTKILKKNLSIFGIFGILGNLGILGISKTAQFAQNILLLLYLKTKIEWAIYLTIIH